MSDHPEFGEDQGEEVTLLPSRTPHPHSGITQRKVHFAKEDAPPLSDTPLHPADEEALASGRDDNKTRAQHPGAVIGGGGLTHPKDARSLDLYGVSFMTLDLMTWATLAFAVLLVAASIALFAIAGYYGPAQPYMTVSRMPNYFSSLNNLQLPQVERSCVMPASLYLGLDALYFAVVCFLNLAELLTAYTRLVDDKACSRFSWGFMSSLSNECPVHALATSGVALSLMFLVPMNFNNIDNLLTAFPALLVSFAGVAFITCGVHFYYVNGLTLRGKRDEDAAWDSELCKAALWVVFMVGFGCLLFVAPSIMAVSFSASWTASNDTRTRTVGMAFVSFTMLAAFVYVAMVLCYIFGVVRSHVTSLMLSALVFVSFVLSVCFITLPLDDSEVRRDVSC